MNTILMFVVTMATAYTDRRDWIERFSSVDCRLFGCFVGKRHLEEAVKSFKEVNFEVNWKPYFLNPTMAEDTHIPFVDYITQKYGAEAAQNIVAGKSSLVQAGAAAGITFNLERNIISTLRSHCLLDYAATVGKQNDVVESMFTRYFEKAEDIGNTAVLTDIAKETGLDCDSAMKHVSDPSIKAKIKEEAASAQGQGVTGVPYFEIFLKGESPESCPRFSGAQPAGTFVSLFTRLLKHAKI